MKETTFRTQIWKLSNDRRAFVIPREYQGEFDPDAIYEITVVPVAKKNGGAGTPEEIVVKGET